jgi:protein-S-isoprenylcysteine O-methyltransferase Ste14
MGAQLFRHRLAVIVGFFLVAGLVAFVGGRRPDLIPLATTITLVGLKPAFLVAGLGCLVAFALRASGEARLGAAVYGQSASSRVVTSGPFRVMRHPLYAGTWLFFTSAAAPYLAPLLAAVFAVAFAACLRLIAIHEETELRAAHGDAWDRYASAVPRFVGVPRAVDDDGLATTARSWALAALSNLGLLSLGLYRVLVATGGNFKGAGLFNVLCLTLWLVVVVVRRVKRR